jgi:hypothetical protein
LGGTNFICFLEQRAPHRYAELVIIRNAVASRRIQASDSSKPALSDNEPWFPSRDDFHDGLVLVLEQKAQSEVELAGLEGPLFP